MHDLINKAMCSLIVEKIMQSSFAGAHTILCFRGCFLQQPLRGGLSRSCATGGTAPLGETTDVIAVPVGEICPFVQLHGLKQ